MFDSEPVQLSKYVDIDDALGRVRGNKSLLKRMFGLFLETNEFSELTDTLNRKDYEEAAKAAHAIKGISGNLSLPVLFECSTNLLGELRAGEPQDITIELYNNALENTLLAVNETIAQLDT